MVLVLNLGIAGLLVRAMISVAVELGWACPKYTYAYKITKTRAQAQILGRSARTDPAHGELDLGVRASSASRHH